MSDAEQENYLLWGIDGGGTKTTVMLAESVPGGEPRVLASILAGSSNVNSRPWREITAELSEVLCAVQQTANRPTGRDAALVAAFAGVGRPSVRQKWEDWFASKDVANRIRIVDDGEPLIAAGLPDGWGVVLIAGTGSSAFGRSPVGDYARAGGWGYLFGDEGSGFAIGRAALHEMTRFIDCGVELTSWMQSISGKWALAHSRDVVERVYSADEPRRCVASVAPIICEAAECGDQHAQRILESAAEELATIVERVAQSLRLTDLSLPLAVSGGLIANSHYLQDKLARALRERGINPAPVTVVTEPARGCIALAEKIAINCKKC